jgi:heme-degrading monooxygenase HmoA
VSQAVVVEFGKFIDAGDLEKTRQRLKKLEQMTEDQDGFLGMYL